MAEKCLLVAAIDFGSTYSGYAVSFRDEPMKVKTFGAWSASTSRLMSLKTATSLLLTPQKEFHSFGFEAEDTYINLVDDESHREWYYFSRFKMLLHNNTTLDSDTIVKDATGKTMPALKVFSMAIEFMKSNLLKNLKLNNEIPTIEQSEIMFVLTVPAIWDDTAKQFMRQAALQAGIDEERLRIVLEPEAASLWCQKLPMGDLKDYTGSDAKITMPGTKYMVVDLGGGTADITVHEIQIGGSLKELHAANGGPWGGTCVDKNFQNFLCEIVGKDVFQTFAETKTEDMIDLMRDFEVNKRSITPDMDRKVTVRLPLSFVQAYETSNNNNGPKLSMEDAINASPYKNKVKKIGDKIRIDVSVAKVWFEQPIRTLIDHLKSLFKEPRLKYVKTIVLVGGFSECKIVQEVINEEFSNKRVIVPADSGLVVLKGAVLFGHQQEVVKSRVARATYGTEISIPYDANVHPLSKKECIDGKEFVSGVFQKYVEVGEDVPIGHTVTEPLLPVTVDQQETIFKLYSSIHKNPKFVSDIGCRHVGSLVVRFADGETIEEKRVECALKFGGAELLLEVTQVKTGEVFHRHFPFR